MRTKCYKCGQKNERDSYKCEKCWEIFRQSKEKYDQYIKKEREEIAEIEKQWIEKEKRNLDKIKKEHEEKEEKSSYRFAYLISVIPLLFWIIRSTLNNGKTSDIIFGAVLTIIMIISKTKVIEFVEKKNKPEYLVYIIMFSLSIVLIAVSVFLLR